MRYSLEEQDILNMYSEFAKQCYYYANGKVNKIYKPDMYLSYDMYSNELGGMRLGRNISVNIPLIVECSVKTEDYNKSENKLDFIKSEILDCVVHELLHSDQFYDYNRYNKDSRYHEYVENQVINATYNFIRDNYEDICQKLKFKFDFSIQNYSLVSEVKFKHIKDNLSKYYASVLSFLCRKPNENYYNDFNHLMESFKTVKLTINNSSIMLKIDDNIIDQTGILPSILHSTMPDYVYNIYVDMSFEYNEEDSNCEIILKTRCGNMTAISYEVKV